MAQRLGTVVIESVEPQLDGGTYAIKRILGEPVEVSADIFQEGHHVLAAVVRWRKLTPAAQATDWMELPMKSGGNDRWTGSFIPPALGRYAFTVEAWPETYATWAEELQRRVDAGQIIKSELLEGAALLKACAERAKSSPEDAERFGAAEKALGRGAAASVVAIALEPALIERTRRFPDRALGQRYLRELQIIVERPRARTGSWYEFFPRSASRDTQRHGNFADCEALLPDIQMMGFDVLYFPPIHPIGTAGRRGKNNSPTASPDDVGSPWAIGSSAGGHKAIHPQLGTLDEFKRLVRHAHDVGMEIALDLAFQCSPDHPYLKEHPEWFQRRPDGTIKTAENPPKRYDDIVNFDFAGPAREALWNELKSVVMYWIENGVRIFRVDNPHTKPIAFWTWLIREVQDLHPDAVFLAEAFTRPKVMKALGKAGFSQSYTYFTWRNFKRELQDYLTEMTTAPTAEYFRGNLWPNTPDILPEILQQGGPPAFKLRLALAATLSSSYGIYSGYELAEGRSLPGKEEYADSEKYQLVKWDPERPGNIRSYVAAINQIRKENSALSLYRNLRFYSSDNDRVCFYGKRDKSNQLLVAVSLDPFSAQEAILEIPLAELGIPADETYQVHELIRNERSLWKGPSALVRLTPDQPASIWRVLRFVRSEQAFDYYN